MEWELLASLPSHDRSELLRSAHRHRFRRGEAVVRDHEQGDALYLIESGIFAVQVSTPSGDVLTINVLKPGDFFGELALLRDKQSPRRTATVAALTTAVALSMSGAAFGDLISRAPAVEELLVRALVQRIDQLGLRLLESLYDSVDKRVVRRLNELADYYSCSNSGEIDIPISQDDLAAMAGASRPTVNQVLQRLTARGMITLGRRSIRIRDFEALRAAAPVLGG